jgi:hypothetical protein
MKRDAAALSSAAAKEGGALTCTNALNGSRSVLMAFTIVAAPADDARTSGAAQANAWGFWGSG